MWIIVATVLLLYVLGLLFICFLNADRNQSGGGGGRRREVDGDAESPSNVDNNSLSASTNNRRGNDGGLRSFYQRHHHQLPSPHPHHHRQLLQRYYQRLFFSRLVSSNFRYEDEEEETRHPGSSLSSSTTASPDPSRSSLFAYRQQQLRQIHHEINEMSYYLLGGGQQQQQSQSDDSSARSIPVPIFAPSTIVQPVWHGSENSSPYSFVHQLASGSLPTMTTGVSMSTRRDSSGVSISCTEGSCSVSATLSENAVGGRDSSFPNSESCHIIRERQRRLRHIRMELEGLSLQLNNADDGHNNASSLSGTTSPFLLLHGIASANTAGNSTMLFNISPPPSGTTLETSNFSPLIYFNDANSETTRLINGVRHSWSIDNEDDDDLPSYESIVCLLNSHERVESSSEEQMEDTFPPPPSYSEAVHLYSFAELEARKK